MVFRKSQFGWVRFYRLISLITGPKFIKLISPHAEGITIQNVLDQFQISLFFLKIFTTKIWSWPKSGQILHVFGP